MNRRFVLALAGIVTIIVAGIVASITMWAPGWLSEDRRSSVEPVTGRSALLGLSPGSGIIRQNEDDLAVDLDTMVDVGAGWIRLDIDWSGIEPEPGRWDWEATDRLIDAANDRGFRILGLLTYTPSWARPPGTSDKHPPVDSSDFTRFVRAAADRYGSFVDAWEIWNEPNSELFWETGPEPERYADLLSAASRQVRLADPTAIVLSGGLAPAEDIDGVEMSPEAFLDGVLASIDPETVDAVAIHPYSFPADPSDGSLDWNLFARLPAIRDQVARTMGRPLPLWLTEFGAPFERDRPERQAEIIADGLGCAGHWDWVGPVFVYSLNDAPDDPGGRAFGLVDPSGQRRPSWTVVRRFAAVPWVQSPAACDELDS